MATLRRLPVALLLPLASPASSLIPDTNALSRRRVLASIIGGTGAGAASFAALASASAAAYQPWDPTSTSKGKLAMPSFAVLDHPDPVSVITAIIENETDIAMADVTIPLRGGRASRTFLAVQGVSSTSEAARQGVRPGMVLMGYPSAARQRLKDGPYPVVLQLCDLGAGLEDIKTPADALEMAIESAERDAGGARARGR